MAARLLAVLAAVAMVVGAVVLRDRRDESDERRTTTVRLVCATELAAVCEALEEDGDTDVRTTVEPTATTFGRLGRLTQNEDAGLDGWLAVGPWPEMVDAVRRFEGRSELFTLGPVVARSPVVLAVWPDRVGALRGTCGQDVRWKCVGDVAGKPWAGIGGDPGWGPVKPGHPPTDTGAGLTVVGVATVGYFDGRTDLSRDDFEDQGFRTWLANVERSIRNAAPSPLENMVLRGPGNFDVVGALEAEAGPYLERSARNPKPTLLYPSPVATADVALGTTAGPAGVLLAEVVAGDRAAEALAQAGWRVPGQASAKGVRTTPALPPTSGLPAPDTLVALRTAVATAARR